MCAHVIGISGSPRPDGTTGRVVLSIHRRSLRMSAAPRSAGGL